MGREKFIVVINNLKLILMWVVDVCPTHFFLIVLICSSEKIILFFFFVNILELFWVAVINRSRSTDLGHTFLTI